MAMSAETKPKTRENIRPPQSGSPQRAINATEPRSAGDEVWMTDFFAAAERSAMLLQI
jgi:hypothetical protein